MGSVWWYAARSAGIVTWALAALSVVWGLLLSTKVLGRAVRPNWLLDLHRFLGGISVLFTGLHIAALVADGYVHFGVADILLPFASSWKPTAVALGVISMWLLLAVEGTSLLMKRLPRKRWHAVHLLSYLLFWMATLHGMLAGTERNAPAFALANDAAALVVVFLTVYRVLKATNGRSGRSASRTSAESRLPSWSTDTP